MTREEEAIELLEGRDLLFEHARSLPPMKGGGLSFEQAAYVEAAEGRHRKAIARLASLHPAYRPAPWGEDFDAA